MKALFLAALVAPALATGYAGIHAGHQGLHDHIHEAIVQKMELTKEQQASIQAIVVAHHPALHADGAAIVRARTELIQALADAKTTEGQIRELEAKGSAADLILELEVNQVVKEIDPLLTDGQRAKAKDLMGELHDHVEGFLAGTHADAPRSHSAGR